MYPERLRETLPKVRDRVAQAALASGRDPDEIRIVAVTKGHPVEAVRAALDAGLVDIGENRVEELERKVAGVGRAGVRWHMIGHLQRRQAGGAMALADLIHSVDSVRLAERISRLATDAGQERVRVLLQVNTSGEETKGGFSIDGALDALFEAAVLPRLDVEGLMTMAPLTEDEVVLETAFRRLRELLDDLRARRPEVGRELSMGMTNDLEIAVAQGSTMVRVGTALFGERSGA